MAFKGLFLGVLMLLLGAVCLLLGPLGWLLSLPLIPLGLYAVGMCTLMLVIAPVSYLLNRGVAK